MFETPISNRLHIGIFGRRNTGKSSIINALTGQKLAIVSDVPGTTTDPVQKAIEIAPIGPCVIIDTAGLDDTGALGEERIKQTLKVLRKTDVALVVMDNSSEISSFEEELIKTLKEKKAPFLFVINKSDIGRNEKAAKLLKSRAVPFIAVSSTNNEGITELKELIISLAPITWTPVPLVSDMVKPGDKVLMVCPIDSAMPKGRLILPQVQVLREILDSGGEATVVKELKKLDFKPDLVITDSQVFDDVSRIVPENIPLTSFSIIYARQKGDLSEYVKGAKAVDPLGDGDEILIAEACTHHPQPEDIGRTKIPTWLLNRTGKELHFDVSAGGDYPEDIKRYKLIISCGGCMVNRREMMHRIAKAKEAGVPITNYGVLIAYLNGILDRVLKPFKV